MLACSKGHVHIVNILINNDAHVNLQNKVYLHFGYLRLTADFLEVSFAPWLD